MDKLKLSQTFVLLVTVSDVISFLVLTSKDIVDIVVHHFFVSPETFVNICLVVLYTVCKVYPVLANIKCVIMVIS